jgi:hypothetical protein
MMVFPRAVGRMTRVFLSYATLEILAWYSLSSTTFG